MRTLKGRIESLEEAVILSKVVEELGGFVVMQFPDHKEIDGIRVSEQEIQERIAKLDHGLTILNLPDNGRE